MAEKIIQATGIPFWSWNDVLEKEELLKQITELEEMGFGGFNMHTRNGLNTEYLGEEYMDCVKACCERAKEKSEAKNFGLHVFIS